MALVNFSGIASGIDSSSLIKATLDQQRTARVTPLQNKIKQAEDSNSAFEKLTELLEKLKTAAAKFRVINGGGVSKSSSSSDDSIVGSAASNGAPSGSYAVSVTKLAKNASFSFDDRYATSNAVISPTISNLASEADRTVQVSIGQGDGQETISVVLDDTTTLASFASQFNAQSTKGQASVINVGTSTAPSYALSITSFEQGTDDGFVAVSVGSAVSSAGVFTASTLSQASNAEFSLSGVSGTLTRSSNSVSDVIAGVTLNFQSLGTATIGITNDATQTAESLRDLVDAYNEVITFVSENDAVKRDVSGSTPTNVFGALASSSLDNNLTSALRSAISASGISGGTLSSLADLGVTTQRDGTLAFDEDTLKDAIASSADNVNTILQNLGESFGSTTGTIAQYTQYNGLIDLASKANQKSISDYQERINAIEKSLASQEETLIQRFSRLEGLIGRLSSQQAQLSSLLPR